MQSYSSKTKQIPMRKCLVTKTIIEKKDLIRFVVDPEDNLIADINQNLPGKGYWVKADRDTISTAINKKLLCKAIKKKSLLKKIYWTK